uniref:BTB domain-containing protein n=1 Tax=Steinernema glaseri TaxID=37863 RepID=A0A1I8AQP5_9BILA
MTNIGKITGTLENELSFSDEVEIAGLKWSLHRGDCYFEFHCVLDYEANVLWSCTARGKLSVWGVNFGRQFLVWSNTFDYMDNEYSCSTRLELPHTSEELDFEADIEVLKFRRIDFSSPTNEAIESPEDAACLEVEGKKIWVSKKILSVHSPFFKAMFSGDFKEETTGIYALKEVNLADFKHFLTVIYNLDILKYYDYHIYLEGLLRLGNMWQCDSVLLFCQDMLNRNCLPLDVKIVLGDRYGFFPFLTIVINNADLENLKRLVKEGYLAEISSFTHCLIHKRLLDST